MRKYLAIMLFITVSMFLFFPASAGAGQITGTVTVKGLRSPANVLVYLTAAPEADMDLSQARFVMDQKDLTFRPHILPLPVGASVSFPNNDKVDHNVFSLSRTQKFNLGSYTPGQSKEVIFEKTGIVELRCDVHAEMLAYILVLKNPYFSVTDANGKFTIGDDDYWKKMGVSGLPDLPPGDYALKTWHEKLKSKKHPVTVPAKGTAAVQVELSRGKAGVLYK